MRRRYLLIPILFCVGSVKLVAQQEAATVHVEVSNAADFVLPDPHSELLELRTGKSVAEFHNSIAKGVPYGDYILRIREPGYKWWEQTVTIRRPEVTIRAKLIVGDFN
jgi:hypothetical protein